MEFSHGSFSSFTLVYFPTVTCQNVFHKQDLQYQEHLSFLATPIQSTCNASLALEDVLNALQM